MIPLFPCAIETENWYWNRQLQVLLDTFGIGWFRVGWNSRTRKYLFVGRGRNKYYLAWMTKNDYNDYNGPKYTAKELIAKLQAWQMR